MDLRLSPARRSAGPAAGDSPCVASTSTCSSTAADTGTTWRDPSWWLDAAATPDQGNRVAGQPGRHPPATYPVWPEVALSWLEVLALRGGGRWQGSATIQAGFCMAGIGGGIRALPNVGGVRAGVMEIEALVRGSRIAKGVVPSGDEP